MMYTQLHTLWRKLQSVGYLLTHEPAPLKAIAQRASENMRQAIVTTKQGKPFIYATKLGFPFVCLPSVETSKTLYLRQQAYEEIELKVAQHWLQAGDTCLDLGANVGYISALFAHQVGHSGRVIAVEAAPQTVKHLEQAKQLLKLPQVYVEPVCVTNQDGAIAFMVSNDSGNDTGNDAGRDGNDVRQALKVGPELDELFHPETVPCTTLNTLIEQHQISQAIALVKMDIEGAEPLALKGASQLFDPNALPLFIVEIYKLGLARMGFEPSDIWSLFSPDLFDLYLVNRSYPNPTPEVIPGVVYALPHPVTHPWGWHTNLIAVPKVGRYAKRRAAIATYLPSLPLGDVH